MKKTIPFLSIFIFVVLACDLVMPATPPAYPDPLPTDTMIPGVEYSTVPPASPNSNSTVLDPTIQPPAVTGAAVSYGMLNLVLPLGIASGFIGNQVPSADADNVAPWEATPGHVRITLDGYLLQEKFHQPQIYVYPGTEYAILVPAAFESMHRLRNLMNASTGSISADQLPAVPFFHAAQMLASNIQPIIFQNGSGVRFLTEYAQYPAPVNNHELFYQFQGFSNDGEYYIVAVFPITVPVLAESSDAGAPLPPGGVPYPDITDPNVDVQGYYAAVTDLLNATPPEAFTPKLYQLDSLIQSMQIVP